MSIISAPEYIKSLKPYIPGKPIEEIQKEFGLKEIYKIASNENPLGPSPKAVASMMKYTSELNRYPDIGAIDLREKLGKKFNLNIQNIVVGSGSEGIMANILRCFLCDEDEMVSSRNTFIGFQVLARGRRNKYIEIQMTNEYKFDLDGILNAINERTKVIYLCNPNNPTGTIFTRKEFDEFYKKVPSNILIIMDEAYFEYAEYHQDYPDSLEYKYDNVITLRTFSKIYGIAGIRIGYGFAHKEIVETLMKVKLPFEPSNLAQAGAIGALDDIEFINKSKSMNKKGYELLTKELTYLNYKWIPSFANFIMIDLKTEDAVNSLNLYMLKKGVIIRPLKPFGLAHCIRVTIGIEKENTAFLNALKALN